MGTRRTTFIVVALLALAGCGSQEAPEAGAPSQNSNRVPGTRPSQTVPPGFQTSTESPTDPPTAGTDPTAPASSVAAEPSFTVIDSETGDFVAGLGNGDVVLGGVGIHGVGAAWGIRRVHVTRSDQGVVAHYDGPGKLQRGTPLDLGVATLSTMVGSDLGDPESVRLRFDVRLDPDGLGESDVWIDGHHYHLSAGEPPHTADPVVAIVADDFRRQDWADLYDHYVHLPGETKQDFVKHFGAGSTVSELTITGPTIYRAANGVPYADAPAHVVATVAGGHHLDRDVFIHLAYQQGEWRFSSMAKTSPRG